MLLYVEYCTEGQTRLINNGLVGDEGRLEVCQHGIWGTVCEDLFTRTDARVVCRDLGFPEECKNHVLCNVYLCNVRCLIIISS